MKRYLVTILIVLLVSLFRIFLDSVLEENISYIIFTFAIVVSAWYGGLGTGLFATLLCVASGMFLSPQPNSVIVLTDSESQLRIALFIIQGAFISILSESVQDATRWQSIILESIADAFITFDRNMRFMYINSQAEKMLQLSRKQLLGKRLVDLYPQAKKTQFYKNCRDSFLTQKTKQFELFFPDDSRWFDVSLYPSNDGISCYYQDITRRKRAERRLRESQLQFKRFVDANIIGVVVEDTSGIIYEANDVFLNMVGYTKDDLKQRRINWREMTPPEYHELDDAMSKKLLKNSTVQPYMKEYMRKDGRRIHVLIGGVLLNKASEKAITFYLDITKQKELEQKKDEFISIASHELKTPLTSVKAFTQILIKRFEMKNDKQTQYFLKNINNQIDKLNELISDLLDASRIEEGKLTYKLLPFPIDELVKKIVVDFQYTTHSHTIIKKGESKHLVLGDEHRIGQVLINLITNAIKYSPQAGKIVITISDKTNSVTVSVTDYGEGIAADEKARIFDRFFRSSKHESSRIAGFGLGLYISKEIIDKHKGEILVESTEGKGSTFSFTLPIIKTTKGQ